MKVALDSNILIYAAGIYTGRASEQARSLIDRLKLRSTAVGVQALGEVYNVLTRKAGLTRLEALQEIHGWQEVFEVLDTTSEVMAAALGLAAETQLQVWDAVHLAAAAAAGCGLFLSEDLQHGYCWRGVTVVNPFRRPAHPLLAAALEL